MKQKLKSYGIMTIGSLIFALAFDWLYAPNQVGMGGITGLAQVVNTLLPTLSVGTLVFVFNIPLFLAGWKWIGFHLLASSMFAMTLSSVAIDAIAAAYTFTPIDSMLAALCGGAMMGLGLGTVFSQGATTGGTDIVARLLKLKFPWLPLGNLILIPDFMILVLAGLVFGRVETTLYGAVALFVSSRVMDVVLYGLDTSKVAYIISDNWEEIAHVMTHQQQRGITILQGRGAYTGREKQVLMVAFKQREIVQVKRTVHRLDERAFLIVCNAHDVLGEGFGDYKKEDI